MNGFKKVQAIAHCEKWTIFVECCCINAVASMLLHQCRYINVVASMLLHNAAVASTYMVLVDTVTHVIVLVLGLDVWSKITCPNLGLPSYSIIEHEGC